DSAPGHQRIVWAGPSQNKQEIYGKYGELFKMYQAYIILNGIIRNNGLIGAKWKDTLKEEEIKNLTTYKGVIRLEKDRWSKGSLGVEIRSGTRDPFAQQFMDKTLISRATT